jgi:hypothetical protein
MQKLTIFLAHPRRPLASLSNAIFSISRWVNGLECRIMENISNYK